MAEDRTRATPVVLSSFVGGRDHYRPVMFSANEVFCGPDAKTERLPDGRFRALRTRAGAYDLAQVVAALPAAQAPDLVVVKTDATNRNHPRNLQRLDCPKVLVVGETQLPGGPLRRMLDYAQEERFDFIISDHNRQHLHVFAKAGFRNVHWLPGLTWRPVFREVPETPGSGMVFVGQVGRSHPYRAWLVERLTAMGVPLTVQHLPQERAADAYAAAGAALNCSRNGDLNLRVFEILGAGGLLFTDALSQASGLQRLLRDGEDHVAYRSPEDLKAKLGHYLAAPEAALEIRRRGRRKVEEQYGPQAMLDAFFDLIDRGVEREEFSLADEPRCQVVLPRPELVGRIAVYQHVQEAHHASSVVRLYGRDDPETRRVAEDCSDLCRLEFYAPEVLGQVPPPPDGLPAREILLLTARDDAAVLAPLLARFHGEVILAVGQDWPVAAYGALAERLRRWGFRMESVDQPVFRRVALDVNIAETIAAGAPADALRKLDAAMAAPGGKNWHRLATLAEQAGSAERRLDCLRQAVKHDRDDQAALSALGMASQAGAAEAFLMLDHLARLRPLTAAEAERHRALRPQAADAPPVAAYLERMRADEPRAAAPKRLLVVTNLFPPQELGGYGRKLWEFTHVLVKRGHEMRVLTADAPDLAQPCASEDLALEPLVSRTLRLYGAWTDGKAQAIDDRDEILRRARHNAEAVLRAVDAFRPDGILLGNLDFIDSLFVAPCLARGVPIVHSVGNAVPGYAPGAVPRHPLYVFAPCSRWLGEALKAGGFDIGDHTVVHPGARVSQFERAVSPAVDGLRIAFGGLVMPYKGAHVLVEALGHLHRAGIGFTCAIAGNSFDPRYMEHLRRLAARGGFADRLTFTGFLDRQGLARLFARSNVLVFPSQFDEPFGITQVEAMAAGLAVVTSGTGGSGEIVRDGVEGLHFDKADAGSLARALMRLDGDKALWRRLGRAGHERAAQFDVKRSCDVLEELFERLRVQAASLAVPATPAPADGGLDALRAAIKLDRDATAALAGLGMAPGANALEAFLALDHLSRLQPLTVAQAERHRAVRPEAVTVPAVATYLARVRPEPRQAAAPMRLLVVTNLFPPQELGGYGRKLWEFTSVLSRRGHDIRVLTADMPALTASCAAEDLVLEPLVSRALSLYGTWTDGKAETIADAGEARRRIRHNTQAVLRAIESVRPDGILLGNVNFMGVDFVPECLRRGVPIVHSLGMASMAGFTRETLPRHPLYVFAPASGWLGEHLKADGYDIGDYAVLYPGARVSLFERPILPALDRLRIAYCGLVMPYKGAHVLIEALDRLHRAGVAFSCTMAGGDFDPGFVARLKAAAARGGFANQVAFPGFLDRNGLARLFARSNVLVFPSMVDETFGIALVEAMAAGLAVVNSATGGSREIVRHEVDGLLFDQGDAAGLASALRRLADDPALWRRLVVAGHERAGTFDVERSGDVLEALFRRLRDQAAGGTA